MKTKLIVPFIVTLLAAQIGLAQIAPVNAENLAIGGYDVVSYFSDKAVKGNTAITTEYEGVVYRFSSKENQAAFNRNPKAFIPQYGGYCAWGVAEKSSKFPIDPETFKVVDGKLYLFFNGPFNGDNFNSLDHWNANEAELLSKSEKNWLKMK